MKRILPTVIAFVLFFSSCTVQETVNSDLFISRFADAFPDYLIESENIFYEGNKSACFVNDASGNRFAVEMTADSVGRLQKISLACVDADKVDETISFAMKIISVYAPDEDSASVINALSNGKYFSYHETLWYSYAFSKTENSLFFSIENKRFAPEKESSLTLKENEITGYLSRD